MKETELQEALNRRAEWWRTNTDDPHGINTAVYVAVKEIANAIAEVQNTEKRKLAK